MAHISIPRAAAAPLHFDVSRANSAAFYLGVGLIAILIGVPAAIAFAGDTSIAADCFTAACMAVQ